MPKWCCLISDDEDIVEEEDDNNEDTEEISSQYSNRRRRGISDLDIREWTIELRENDLTMDERNVKKKSAEAEESHKKALHTIEEKEKEIEEKIAEIALEKKQLVRTYLHNKNDKIIFDNSITVQLKVEEKTKSVVLHVHQKDQGIISKREAFRKTSL